MGAARFRCQEGAGAVVVCALAALAGALTLGIGRLASAMVATARAETAADAAALAAAGELAAGRSETAARRIAAAAAAANGARLVRCRCRGPAATTVVSVTLPSFPSFPREAGATARAEIHPQCPG